MTKEDLIAIGVRLKKTMSESAAGPLIVAREVIGIVNNWSDVGQKGVTAEQWITRTLGRGYTIRWFQRRVDAVDKLGEASRRFWHHQGAVWAATMIKNPMHLKKLNDEVWAATKANASVPISSTAVMRIARKLGIKKPLGKTPCANCEKLKKRIAELEGRRMGDAAE